MKTKLKIGDVLRVFQIEKDIYKYGHTGKWVTEKKDDFHFDKFGVNLSTGSECCHYGIDNRRQAILVGKLTVTKVK